MEYFIAIILLIASIHFIYEGIVLPGIRIYLRNRLFAYRDELRSLYIEERETLDHEVFNIVHDSLTNMINRIHNINISNNRKFILKYGSDEEFRKVVDKRREKVESYEHEKLNKIVHDVSCMFELAFFANCGAWFVYIIPLILVLISIKALSAFAMRVFVAPINEINKLIPEEKYA